jgi:hypothetical protein
MGKAKALARINPSNFVESGKESEEDGENEVCSQYVHPYPYYKHCDI